jgi:hypothetical protein
MRSQEKAKHQPAGFHDCIADGQWLLMLMHRSAPSALLAHRTAEMPKTQTVQVFQSVQGGNIPVHFQSHASATPPLLLIDPQLHPIESVTKDTA